MPNDERAQLIQGLRDLADFLEARPDLPAPAAPRFDIWAKSRAEFTAYVRQLGKSTKHATDPYMWFRREFGPVALDVVAHREKVCTKRVVGVEEVPERTIPAHTREIVEWDCGPILERGT